MNEMVDGVLSVLIEPRVALTLFSFESLLVVSVVGGWDRLLVSEGNVLKTGETRELLKWRENSRVVWRLTG